MALERPDHLDPDGDWLSRHVAGVAALALGVASFLVVAIVHRPLWSTPPVYLSLPGFAAAAVAALASLARRERAVPLWLAGLGAAAAALVLGWFLMLAIIVGATAILVLILHSVM